MNKVYKNLIIAAAFSFIGFMCFSNEAKAEEHKLEWDITYTQDQQLTSTFDASKAKFDDVMPGDTIVYQVNMINNYSGSADFFMEANVLKTLELGDGNNQTGAANGAYEYYIVSSQLEMPVFSSDTVGGDTDFDDVVGLSQISGQENAFLSLGTVEAGKSGNVVITIKLDGNTQDNSYKSQLGQLQFVFGAEPTDSVRTGNDTIVEHNEIVKKVVNVVPGETEIIVIDDDSIPLSIDGNPRTGDSILPILFCGIALILGLSLIVIYFRMTKEEKEEVA